MALKRAVTIRLIPREDGGLRVSSDELLGLVLSGNQPNNVMNQILPAIAALHDAEKDPPARAPAPERSELSASLKTAIKAEWPNVTLKTNDDMNPGTPIVVTVTWPDRVSHRTHTFRAYRINQTQEELNADALNALKIWRAKADAGFTEPKR